MAIKELLQELQQLVRNPKILFNKGLSAQNQDTQLGFASDLNNMVIDPQDGSVARKKGSRVLNDLSVDLKLLKIKRVTVHDIEIILAVDVNRNLIAWLSSWPEKNFSIACETFGMLSCPTPVQDVENGTTKVKFRRGQTFYIEETDQNVFIINEFGDTVSVNKKGALRIQDYADMADLDDETNIRGTHAAGTFTDPCIFLDIKDATNVQAEKFYIIDEKSVSQNFETSNPISNAYMGNISVAYKNAQGSVSRFSEYMPVSEPRNFFVSMVPGLFCKQGYIYPTYKGISITRDNTTDYDYIVKEDTDYLLNAPMTDSSEFIPMMLAVGTITDESTGIVTDISYLMPHDDTGNLLLQSTTASFEHWVEVKDMVDAFGTKYLDNAVLEIASFGNSTTNALPYGKDYISYLAAGTVRSWDAATSVMTVTLDDAQFAVYRAWNVANTELIQTIKDSPYLSTGYNYRITWKLEDTSGLNKTFHGVLLKCNVRVRKSGTSLYTPRLAFVYNKFSDINYVPFQHIVTDHWEGFPAGKMDTITYVNTDSKAIQIDPTDLPIGANLLVKNEEYINYVTNIRQRIVVNSNNEYVMGSSQEIVYDSADYLPIYNFDTSPGVGGYINRLDSQFADIGTSGLPFTANVMPTVLGYPYKQDIFVDSITAPSLITSSGDLLYCVQNGRLYWGSLSTLLLENYINLSFTPTHIECLNNLVILGSNQGIYYFEMINKQCLPLSQDIVKVMCGSGSEVFYITTDDRVAFVTRIYDRTKDPYPKIEYISSAISEISFSDPKMVLCNSTLYISTGDVIYGFTKGIWALKYSYNRRIDHIFEGFEGRLGVSFFDSQDYSSFYEAEPDSEN